MVGVITTWDLLAHPIASIQSFGWGIFFRAVFRERDRSLLSLVREAFAPSAGLSPLLHRCILLELRAKRIFTALAKAFAGQSELAVFFADLAQQEQDHADLLELCRTAAIRGDWQVNLFNPWQDYLPRLERQMDEAEDAVRQIDSAEAALLLVLKVESSEINYVFQAALAATDSAFVRRLKPFRDALDIHLAFIVDRLPQFAPYLTLACRELRAHFPRVR